MLRHKSLFTIGLYTKLDHALFQEKDDQFHIRIAKIPEEIKELLEIGFEYICEKGGLMFFRKRK